MGKRAVSVKGFPGYVVTGDGDILSHKYTSMRKLKPMISKSGHLYVFLYNRESKIRKKAYVHRVILENLLREPNDNEEARHLDGNPANNNITNLTWGTRLENMRDKDLHGNQTRGASHPPAKLTESDVLEIRCLAKSGKSIRNIGAQFGISHTAARRAIVGITWRHINGY